MSPCDTQPGTAGQITGYPSEGSGARTTVNFMAAPTIPHAISRPRPGERDAERGRALRVLLSAHPVPTHARESEEAAMVQSEMYRKGSEVRRRLLGDAYVERSDTTTYADPVLRTFIDLATEIGRAHL